MTFWWSRVLSKAVADLNPAAAFFVRLPGPWDAGHALAPIDRQQRRPYFGL